MKHQEVGWDSLVHFIVLAACEPELGGSHNPLIEVQTLKHRVPLKSNKNKQLEMRLSITLVLVKVPIVVMKHHD